jgi:hypothetical protein
MGKIKQGILGGFSGKVGTVVGGNWKGINYMRALPQHVENPRTEGQRSQRGKFTLVMKFLKPMSGFLRTGWKLYAHRQTPFNAAMSHTLLNAVTGTYPDYTIVPSKVLVSRGVLAPAAGASATPAEGGRISFTWEDNSGVATAKKTDKALIVVINASKDEAVYDTAGANRSAAAQNIVVPNDWISDDVLTYLGFIDHDAKNVANSVFLGSMTII